MFSTSPLLFSSGLNLSRGVSRFPPYDVIEVSHCWLPRSWRWGSSGDESGRRLFCCRSLRNHTDDGNDLSGTEIMHSSPRYQVPNTTDSPYPTATEDSRPLPRLFSELYVKANALQRTVNIRALELLQSSFSNKPKAGQQQFLDLGCGTVDFTLQELLPRCQPCRRILDTDVAKEMVGYARENYPHPQKEYEVYDIADDASGLVESHRKFDRVYSFFVLQWMKDQVTAFGHISDLMASGGECLLTIVARSTSFTIRRRIVRMDRWKSYAQICEFYTPVSHNISDHSGLISYMMKVLKTVNLVFYTCEVLRIELRAEDMDETIAPGSRRPPLETTETRGSRRTKDQPPEFGLLPDPQRKKSTTQTMASRGLQTETPAASFPVVYLLIAPRTPTFFLGEIYDDLED
ncbi:hypothetical protein HPB47_026035 [Ixodes persulcatus]|uniref:Uncharacterized protein n=1 Tax=Ixodes persulcatus TaxID=34615 RepID=A0AC60Q1R9_IXOPE|nr:hypothetical protein HPB47_026035 [Ixodes persulcatus]